MISSVLPLPPFFAGAGVGAFFMSSVRLGQVRRLRVGQQAPGRGIQGEDRGVAVALIHEPDALGDPHGREDEDVTARGCTPRVPSGLKPWMW